MGKASFEIQNAASPGSIVALIGHHALSRAALPASTNRQYRRSLLRANELSVRRIEVVADESHAPSMR
jgi:hypothetical protein